MLPGLNHRLTEKAPERAYCTASSATCTGSKWWGGALAWRVLQWAHWPAERPSQTRCTMQASPISAQPAASIHAGQPPPTRSRSVEEQDRARPNSGSATMPAPSAEPLYSESGKECRVCRLRL